MLTKILLNYNIKTPNIRIFGVLLLKLPMCYWDKHRICVYSVVLLWIIVFSFSDFKLEHTNRHKIFQSISENYSIEVHNSEDNFVILYFSDKIWCHASLQGNFTKFSWHVCCLYIYYLPWYSLPKAKFTWWSRCL